MTTQDAIWIILGDTGTTEDYITAKAMGCAPVPHYMVKEAAKHLRDGYSNVIAPLANRRQTALAVLHHLNHS